MNNEHNPYSTPAPTIRANRCTPGSIHHRNAKASNEATIIEFPPLFPTASKDLAGEFTKEFNRSLRSGNPCSVLADENTREANNSRPVVSTDFGI
ncbi:MAG: hypothetical protein VX335_03620 [Pseudomonadota bacterium]|nr:hypothetical protein [Pseudomonadota bacterium]